MPTDPVDLSRVRTIPLTVRPNKVSLTKFAKPPRKGQSAADFLAGLPVLGESELYDEVCDRLGATDDGSRASAIELAFEGLYLARKIGKDSDGAETVYG